jgi:hypothetical protein
LGGFLLKLSTNKRQSNMISTATTGFQKTEEIPCVILTKAETNLTRRRRAQSLSETPGESVFQSEAESSTTN